MQSNIVTEKPLLHKRILIVEDDHFISRVYTKWLTAAGADIMTANDGAQGLRLLQQHTFDLVLLDLGMPGLNGYDTLLEIRKIPKLVDLPVVVLSNTTMKENKEGFKEIRDAGVKDVLRKYETSLTEIIHRIESYFDDKQLTEKQ